MRYEKSESKQAPNSYLSFGSARYICAECGTEHTLTELTMADNGLDYSYYCKKCGDVIESNGNYYGKRCSSSGNE